MRVSWSEALIDGGLQDNLEMNDQLRYYKQLLVQSLPRLFPCNSMAPSLPWYWVLFLNKKTSTQTYYSIYIFSKCLLLER